MADACGVDFGTSNSTVGWSRPGQSALLALEDGKATLPSVVFFNAEDDTVSFGRAALASYLAGHEGRLMRSLKSLLGSSLIDGHTEVLGRAVPYRTLLSQFIGALKNRAENAAGREFDCVVLGRPVFFVDGNADADRLAEKTLADIAHAVGFKEVAFQYEPIAAAFDYESQIDREQLVMVADIGGGTSDFSLVRLSPARSKNLDRRADVLATAGVHIGGTDFDTCLSLSSVMPLLGLGSRLKNNSEMPSSIYFNLATWHTINLAYTRHAESELKDIYRDAVERDKLDRLRDLVAQRAGHWLALKVEQGKIELSNAMGTLSVGADEQGILERGRAPYKRRVQNARERVQWVSSFAIDPSLYAELRAGGAQATRYAPVLEAFRAGDIERARTLLASGIGRDEAAASYFLLADIAIYRGNAREAVEWLQKAGARFPGEPRTAGLLERAYLFADEPALA